MSVFFGQFALSEQNADNLCQLTVHFETPKDDAGKIYFLVFDNPENMGNKNKAYKSGIADSTTVVLSLPYGEYAITAFQDTKHEGKITTNLFGIPTEPVGASDNPKLIGIPNWGNTSFLVNQPKQEITISLKMVMP